MKKIIIILGTIVLAVYIVSSLILANTGSLKEGATDVTTKAITEIGTITN